MKIKHTLLGLALTAALVLPASAAETLNVNGRNLWEQARARMVGNTTYVSLRAVTGLLAPEAQVAWENGEARVRGLGLTLTARQIGRAHV